MQPVDNTLCDRNAWMGCGILLGGAIGTGGLIAFIFFPSLTADLSSVGAIATFSTIGGGYSVAGLSCMLASCFAKPGKVVPRENFHYNDNYRPGNNNVPRPGGYNGRPGTRFFDDDNWGQDNYLEGMQARVDIDGIFLGARTNNRKKILDALAKGIPIDIISPYNDTNAAIHEMARDGNLTGLQLLLSFGSNFECPDRYGYTPLRYAIAGIPFSGYSQKHDAMITCLLQQGADPYAKYNDTDTIYQACPERYKHLFADYI